MAERPRILLVGSRESSLTDVADQAERNGIDVRRAKTALDALRILTEQPFDLVLSQARLEDASGLKVARKVRALRSSPVMLIIGPPVSPSRRAEILAGGAEEYIELPAATQDLTNRIQQSLSTRRMADETGLLGRSPRMLQVFETIKQVAPTKITVLVTGESGTGKEVAARAIHYLSPRREGPFVAVNCGAIPEGLLESELFGHEKGAFTGAASRHLGRFEQADGGTLLLDEIGETPLNLQVKLLRALENQTFYRVGGNQPVRSDVRLIAATNQNLEDAVARGLFRRDLYFRLRVVTLALPPLRERLDDIPLLVERFLAEAAARHGAPLKSISPEALEQLAESEWPGNVRELQNLMESLSVLVQGDRIEAETLTPHMTPRAERHENLPVSVGGTKEDAEREIIYRTLITLRSELADLKSILLGALRGTPVEPIAGAPGGDSGPATLSEAEAHLIDDALRRTGGNRRRAAELLGISERTLYRRLRRRSRQDPSADA